MNRHLVTAALSVAISAALCAQSQYPQPNNGASGTAVQNSAAYPAPKPTTNNAPKTVYLPSGLDIQIRLNESLSSATAQIGDTFTGTLVNSIDDDDNNVLFERGASVTGRVVSVKQSGRLQDSGELVLTLNSIRSERLVANLTTISKEVTGESHAGSNAKKVGGGAVLGAIIGGIAGGGKGAAIGAGAGAAAGTGAAAATGKKEAKIDAESMIHFVTSTETAVVPAGSPADREMNNQPNVYNTGPRDDNAPVLQRRRGSDPVSDTNDQYPRGNTGSYPDQQSSNRPRSTTTTARNYPDPDAPVLVRREGSSSDTANPAATTTTNTTNSNTAPNSTANTSTSTHTENNTATSTVTSTATSWSFSQRDRRVIASCLADNPGSVPPPDAAAIPYSKGDTLPYAAQKKIRSLPLACERQLPAVANDQERVIYNQQVLLINTNSLILDAMDIPKQ